ncbi:MAG: hypothetical protein ACOZCP_04255 [Pseudomonadota bacterium]
MLSLQECFDLSDLSEDEIEAIAEHEHVPPIIAAELGTTLLKTKTGMCLLKVYLLEAIEKARLAGDFDKAERLDSIYSRFEREHPAPRVLQ